MSFSPHSTAIAGAFALMGLTTAGAAFGEPPPSPLPSCAVHGVVPMPKGTAIYAGESGDHVLGRFTGATTPVYLSQLPADPRAGRALIATSTGQGSVLRLEGWVRPADVPLFVTVDVASIPGKVAIARGARVTLTRVSADGIEIEHAIAGTSGQTVRTKTTCDVLSLTPPGLTEPTTGGRRFIAQGKPIDLYETPGGAVAFTLKLAADGVQGFRAAEVRGGFARVTARTDLALDGWVRTADLSPVPPGEVRDRYIPPQSPVPMVVKLGEEFPVARAARESTLRDDADKNARAIGVVEPGAEVLVLSTIQGFVSVVPRGIGVMALERKGFWMAASDLEP